MQKAYKIITNIILVILIAIAALMVVPRLFGMTPLAVLSGSMEPTYHVGSLVFVGKASPEDVKQGDPITFKISEDTMVTHRVIAIDTVNQCFYTKGDANNTPDGGSVSYDNLVGKPAFTIPLLGYLAVYAQTTSGMIILVTVILVVLILTFLPDFLFDKDDKASGKQNKERLKHENRRKDKK
ncbi:MAG: signal peptidase I [Eubacteriaceae bacterium]|nr:signal peptidase I [Eubacteriaceae bacterium]